MFPSVAFRPVGLLALCALLTALAVGGSAAVGHVTFGIFFGVGLLLGLINALLVRHSVSAITADAHPSKRKMAVNSAARLAVITLIGLSVGWIFRPEGTGVLLGLALFQVVLVLSTALPVWKKLRDGEPDSEPDETNSAASCWNSAASVDDMFKD